MPILMAELLEPAPGKRVSVPECFKAYAAKSQQLDKAPVTAQHYVPLLNVFCEHGGISSEKKGNVVYLLGVRLVEPKVVEVDFRPGKEFPV